MEEASSTAVTKVLETLARRSGVALRITSNGVAVDDHEISLPVLTGERAELFGIEGLLPTVPRADDRDKLLWRVVGEAREGQTPDRWRPPPLDRDLASDLPDALPFTDPVIRDVIAQSLAERFYSSKKIKALLPLHGSLPLNYAHSTATRTAARYRMFSGEIIPFLLFDDVAGAVDRDLLERLLALFATESDLTSLDLLFLSVARDRARDPALMPTADALLDRYEEKTRTDLSVAGGPFCRSSLNLFRRDLATVLDTELPRTDKVQWLTLLLSLHIGSRLYRLALVKGNELDLAIAAAGNLDDPPGINSCSCDNSPTSDSSCLLRCPLAGEIRFRTGTGRYRPVSGRDGCRQSYVDLDQRRLLALPATLVVSNLALTTWSSLGGPGPQSRSMIGLTKALRDDEAFRHVHSVACAAIAVLHHAAYRPKASTFELEEASRISVGRPGMHALREDVLRLRRRDLRHQSRDILNQLLLDANASGSGSLISRNGTHTFFEMDERLLLLLVRLVCRDDAVPYERFLEGLTRYGLAPQDASERAGLADALERLGLLVRYSDAGEASFVHYA